jgi:hypothetical protein
MVQHRFLVAPLGRGWQVRHQTKTYGPYTTHCEATLAAMLLAQIASEVGISADVVLQLNGALPQVVLAGRNPSAN